MNDIKAWDQKLFWKEVLSLRHMFTLVFWTALVVLALHGLTDLSPALLAVFVGTPFLVVHLFRSLGRSVAKRFDSHRLKSLWETCEERLKRLEAEVKQLRSHKIADLNELPKTISGTSQQLYFTLRRADRVLSEVTKSERSNLAATPPVNYGHSADQQAQELYRVADKNIAEYQKHFRAVIGSVQRAEAQAAVFSTTLDMLRMKMLSHRLAGRKVETENLEFMQSITEAKMQLDAIDKALDELELTPFPTMVAIDPGTRVPPASLFEEPNEENKA